MHRTLSTVVVCIPCHVPDHVPPEIDALRARAEQGVAEAQDSLGLTYAVGAGVPQDNVQAHMWRNVAASRQTGEERKMSADARDALAGLMTPTNSPKHNASPASGTRRTRVTPVPVEPLILDWDPKIGHHPPIASSVCEREGASSSATRCIHPSRSRERVTPTQHVARGVD